MNIDPIATFLGEWSVSINTYSILLRIGVSLLLGALIGCERASKRHAAGLTPVVTKASAGAIEHLAVAKVANIAATVEMLKKEGLWIYAAEAGGSDFRETDMNRAVALVLGSEGDGVSEVVRKKCDYVVSIPMYGKVNSFNVSTAAAVLLCEAAYQQRKG